MKGGRQGRGGWRERGKEGGKNSVGGWERLQEREGETDSRRNELQRRKGKVGGRDLRCGREALAK